MKALNRALLRDFGRLRAQVLTLSLVVAAGAGVFVAMKLTVDALDGARGQYFRVQRFADLFGGLKRAPRAILLDLAAIDGIAQIDGRVAGDVPLFVPGHTQPATVHLQSIDAHAQKPLGTVRIRQGRLPDPDRDNEVVLNEPFAEANRLKPGDGVAAVLNGRLRQLRVVGIGISPEFVFSLPPGVLAPNDERYGVAWMLRAPLESAFDVGGAFNDIAVQLAPGAVRADVIAALDRRLARFGGHGVYARADQQSFRMLDERIARLRGMLVFIPGLFLLVAAFVLNVVLGRLVEGQREQVGALKAFGYSNGRLAGHYLTLATLTVVPGALVGVAGGLELGHALVHWFVHYFRLPLISDGVDWGAVIGAVSVVLLAAFFGALSAVRRATRLHPVEAMRPPSPPLYRHGLVERLRLTRQLPAAVLMVARNVRIAPMRAIASIAALALATALCIVGSFFGGSLDVLLHHQFETAMREDLSVSLVRPVSPSVCASLAALDGVVTCEPLSATPVRAHFGEHSRQTAVMTLPDHGTLRRIIARDGQPVAIPPAGLMVSRRLLQRLGAEVGDGLTLETVEGRPRWVTVPVTEALDDELGLSIYATAATLSHILGEAPTTTQALLRVAPGREAQILARLSAMPVVVGVTSRAAAIADFEKSVAKSLRVMTTILAVLAAVLAIAVVYNGARVALAESARDLASLRVLGFTRAEVGWILLGEMAIAVAVGVPLGWGLGHLLAAGAVAGMAADEFRLPLVITTSTYLLATLVVVGASLVSALQMRRLINRLDLVEVLKTRE
jgi:putative ABC transport system permease protein